MDSLKKPEVALSAAALATSVGIGIYSYNSINELKVSVVEIKEGIVKVGNIFFGAYITDTQIIGTTRTNYR